MKLRVIEESDGLTHVALEGDLDIPGVNAIQDQFSIRLTARRKPAIVEMSGVRFLSSLGMGMLVRVTQSLRRHGVGMVLLSPGPQIEDALRMTNIDQVIPIVASREEALARLAPEAPSHPC